MYQGSCHCGQVKYQIDGELGDIVSCHCSQCRKSQGSAFATNAPVKTSEFTILTGSDLIREYPTSADKVRAFCQNCGSPLYSQLKTKPEIMRLRIGSLDTRIRSNTDSAYLCRIKSGMV